MILCAILPNTPQALPERKACETAALRATVAGIFEQCETSVSNYVRRNGECCTMFSFHFLIDEERQGCSSGTHLNLQDDALC